MKKATFFLWSALLMLAFLSGCQSSGAGHYQQTAADYAALRESSELMSDAERAQAYAELFGTISKGEPDRAADYAKMVEEITGKSIAPEHVFSYADSCAHLFTLMSKGKEDLGLEDLRLESDASNLALAVDFTGDIRYSVSLISSDEPEYDRDGQTSATEPLGKYRLKVTFFDTDLSDAFSAQYSNFEVFELASGTDTVLKVKVVPTADHGFILYVGSDRPFSTTEQQNVSPNLAMGTIKVLLF